MNVIIVCYIFVFAVIFSIGRPVNAELLTPDKISLINAGQALILDGQRPEALELFTHYHYTYPEDPAGYLYRAAVLHADMTDAEADLYGHRFLALCDSTKLSAEKIMTSCRPSDSALCFLYLGHQYSYRCMYEARFGSLFSALSYGSKAKDRYISGLAADSTLYDLYLGLGSFYYWKSAKAGLLRTVGLFKNDMDEGMAYIKLAIDSARFSRDPARLTYIWILINEENYDSAMALSQELYKRYPNGNTFIWPEAMASVMAKKYDRAIELFYRLLNSLKGNPGNYYNVIEAVYYINTASEKIRKSDLAAEALDYLNAVYSQIPKDIRRQQKNKLTALLRD